MEESSSDNQSSPSPTESDHDVSPVNILKLSQNDEVKEAHAILSEYITEITELLDDINYQSKSYEQLFHGCETLQKDYDDYISSLDGKLIISAANPIFEECPLILDIPIIKMKKAQVDATISELKRSLLYRKNVNF
jgi:hypothetical protein